jgi:hypothetical protein
LDAVAHQKLFGAKGFEIGRIDPQRNTEVVGFLIKIQEVGIAPVFLCL